MGFFQNTNLLLTHYLYDKINKNTDIFIYLYILNSMKKYVSGSDYFFQHDFLETLHAYKCFNITTAQDLT